MAIPLYAMGYRKFSQNNLDALEALFSDPRRLQQNMAISFFDTLMEQKKANQPKV